MDKVQKLDSEESPTDAAAKDNVTHGLRRTNADKRHALEMAWENRAALFPADLKECHYASTLAELCGVTRETATVFLKSAFCQILTKSDSEDTPEDTANAASVHALLREGKDRFGTLIPARLVPALHARARARALACARTRTPACARTPAPAGARVMRSQLYPEYYTVKKRT